MENYIEFPKPNDGLADEGADEDEMLRLPAKYKVCPTCRGNGSHVNPAIDGSGISRRDFDEDPSFREDYFNGVFDIQCRECHGLRVVLTVDEDRADPVLLKLYRKHQEEEYQYERLCEAERRAGC